MPVVRIGEHDVDFPDPWPKPPKRLPVAHLPTGGHGDSVGLALGCQCRACRIAHTREVLTSENWDVEP